MDAGEKCPHFRAEKRNSKGVKSEMSETGWTERKRKVLQAGNVFQATLFIFTGLVRCAVLCLVTKSCLTLCNPMDCSPPGSSVHGISQIRILAWVAMSSSRGSSQPRDRTQVSRIAGRFFTSWASPNKTYGLNNRTWFTHSSGGWKSKIKSWQSRLPPRLSPWPGGGCAPHAIFAHGHPPVC